MPEEAHATFSRVLFIKDFIIFVNLNFLDFYKLAGYTASDVKMPFATFPNNLSIPSLVLADASTYGIPYCRAKSFPSYLDTVLSSAKSTLFPTKMCIGISS